MKRFLRWLIGLVDNTSSIPRSGPAKPAPINKSTSSLDHWQKNDERVNWARGSVEFAELLSIYDALHPTGYPVRGAAVTDIQAAVELGRKEGYMDGRAVLMSLRSFPANPPTEIQSNYLQDEETQSDTVT